MNRLLPSASPPFLQSGDWLPTNGTLLQIKCGMPATKSNNGSRTIYSIVGPEHLAAQPTKFYEINDAKDSNAFADSEAFIYDLPDVRYTLLKPIPVLLNYVGAGEWVASFEEANIAMSGDDPEDAKESLTYDILYAMESYCAEEAALIPDLKRTLTVLRQYIV